MLGVASFVVVQPVFATSCEGVDTAIIDCGDNESGIGAILKAVIDIASVGVGVLGAIGITVAGIQYLTAKDSEEQVRKAKRRIFEIVIGLIAYALIYAVISWLMPNGVTDPSSLEHYEGTEPGGGNGGSGGSGGSGGGNGGNNGGGGAQTATQDCDPVDKEWVDVNVGTIKGYYINVPQGANENTPIMIYLHGCGEAYASARTNLSRLKSVTSMFSSSSFISVVPHSLITSSCGTEWNAGVVKNIIDGAGEVGSAVSAKLSSCGGVASRKKYIMGMSDGAVGTWNVVSANPNMFEAAAPVAGGGYNLNGSNFSHTRIVGVVGSADSRVGNMKTGITTIKNSNPSMNPLLVIYSGKDHDNITASIDYGALFNCLLNKSCSNFGSGTTIFYGN